VKCAQDAVLILFLLIIGNHAMLELPLHYAYFLLPTGLVMGTLNARRNAKPILLTGRWCLLLLWLLAVALLSFIIRDYSRVETSYRELRFEQAHIKTEIPGRLPDVLLLTQLRDFIRLSHFKPTGGMSEDDLDWMRKLALTYPGTATISKLALALALNNQALEAQQWLEKMCRIEPQKRCNAVKGAWINQSPNYPELAAVPWSNPASAATSP
jgi:hypothetical protein